MNASHSLKEFNDYVGLAWNDLHCWDLVCLVYRDVLGIEITEYQHQPADDVPLRVQAMEEGQHADHWVAVDAPIRGDVAMMYDRATQRPLHVGVMVNGKLVLHSMKASGVSAIHRIDLLKSKFHKIEYFRHASNFSTP